MGPTGFVGLNEALKQMFTLKQESLRPLMSQSLFKMLILSGLKEPLAVTTATPLDLKSKVISVACSHIYSVPTQFFSGAHHSWTTDP